MNVPDESQIEQLLRRSPQPKAPGELKEKLIMQAKSSPTPSRSSVLAPAGRSWLQRWWPALAPAGISLICAVVLAVQQMEIRDLKQSVQTLSPGAGSETTTVVPRARSGDNPAEGSVPEAQEIARLKELVASLTAEVAQLEKLRDENVSLRAKLSAAPSGLDPADLEAMDAARQRAMKIQCINNLKQLGLAARIWSSDNGDIYPPDIVCMSNEMNTPKILVCPADTSHRVAPDFSSFTPSANCSYEWYLIPRGSDTEPTRVLTRCPIHNSVGLYDGSVQSLGTNQTGFVQRDGKLYFEPTPGAK